MASPEARSPRRSITKRPAPSTPATRSRPPQAIADAWRSARSWRPTPRRRCPGQPPDRCWPVAAITPRRGDRPRDCWRPACAMSRWTSSSPAATRWPRAPPTRNGVVSSQRSGPLRPRSPPGSTHALVRLYTDLAVDCLRKAKAARLGRRREPRDRPRPRADPQRPGLPGPARRVPQAGPETAVTRRPHDRLNLRAVASAAAALCRRPILAARTGSRGWPGRPASSRRPGRCRTSNRGTGRPPPRRAAGASANSTRKFPAVTCVQSKGWPSGPGVIGATPDRTCSSGTHTPLERKVMICSTDRMFM